MRPHCRSFLESLERRFALSADVDASGQVVPLDALLIANALNELGEFASNSRLDVTGDGMVSAADFDAVTDVLNHIDGSFDGSAGGTGETIHWIAEGEGSGCGTGNAAPIAGDDDFAVPFSDPIPLDVLGNDEDPDDDPLTIVALGETAEGGTVSTDGTSITYFVPLEPTEDIELGGTIEVPADRPEDDGGVESDPGGQGLEQWHDSFEYTVADPYCGSDTAFVTLQIVTPPAWDHSLLPAFDTAEEVGLMAHLVTIYEFHKDSLSMLPFFGFRGIRFGRRIFRLQNRRLLMPMALFSWARIRSYGRTRRVSRKQAGA